jgi:hypothetical protein
MVTSNYVTQQIFKVASDLMHTARTNKMSGNKISNEKFAIL